MGVDFVVRHGCAAKRALGGGDPVAGAKELVRLVKVRDIARVLEHHAKSRDLDPAELSVTQSQRNVATGQVTSRKISYGELVADAAGLDPHAAGCEACMVNVLEPAFGCYGAIQYPITAETETWLMARLRPADEAGGMLLVEALEDPGYDGAPIARMRGSADLMALRAPVSRVLDPEDPDATTVTSDQVLHAMLAVGGELGPTHLLMLLIWLGAIRLDGELPREIESVSTLVELDDIEERLARTTIDLGDEASPALLAIRSLLLAAYAAWLTGVPLSLDG